MLRYDNITIPGSDRGLFHLDPEAGLLSLNSSYSGAFDRETRDLYVFIVRATDAGGKCFLTCICASSKATIVV